ncbi:hypothetical protein C1H46_022088 [Malus baccata]|uniref:Uncharacterized protein n=1 Tax=Malus baccata TaxID=106549 RepID=A0A540M0L3_MALBA|nr:hypothetical protein C1H46_022088 [Malus baccata]
MQPIEIWLTETLRRYKGTSTKYSESLRKNFTYILFEFRVIVRPLKSQCASSSKYKNTNDILYFIDNIILIYIRNERKFWPMD